MRLYAYYKLDLKERMCAAVFDEGLKPLEVRRRFPFVHKSTVYRTLNTFAATGKITVRGKNNVFKMSSHHLSLLKSIVDNDPQLFLDEIQEALFQQSGVQFSISTISVALRSKLKYTLKILEQRAIQRSFEERTKFCKLIDELIEDGATPEMFCFIDESHVTRMSARRRRGRSLRGKKITVSNKFIDERYSLLAAFDSSGFLMNVCEIVDVTQDATITQDKFLTWFERNLRPYLGDFSLKEERSIVVLDNASVHGRIGMIEQLVKHLGTRIILLPPYSPGESNFRCC